MSLTATFASIAAAEGTKFLGGLFGKKENIAKSLSKQVGFTVLQKDAPMVRDRIARGLDPRTGLPTGGTVPGVPPAPGVPEVSAGLGDAFNTIARQVFRVTAPRLISKLTDREIQEAINRPATGRPPPVRGRGPSMQELGFPPVSRRTLSIPARVGRRMVPPTPPGGGRMSLIGAAGMSSLPAIASRGVGIIRTQTGRIGRIFLPSGASVSKRDAASLIRRVGFEAAAVALGITAIEAAELLLQESARKRRGRGITAAQVRNARRTTCMVARLARDLGVKAAPVRRRKTCRS